MAAPTTITDLSVTIASNGPAGTDAPSVLDDYQRALGAIVRRTQAQGAAIASATTTSIGASSDGEYVHITGTTTITSFGTVASGIERTLVFDGALTLTHSANLILPGAANITTVAGQCITFRSEGSGVWRMISGSILPLADFATSATNATNATTSTTQPVGTSDTTIATTEFVSTAVAQEAGAVMAFARNTPPSGWLECNGANVSRTTYATLFSAIGTVFGVGDGSTTFALPDLRGEFIRGWDNARGVDSGRSFGSAQADELKSHYHAWGKQKSFMDGSTNSVGQSGAATYENTSSTGGAETRPRNIALLYCIKT